MKICSNKDFEFLVKDQSLRLKALAKARTEKNPAGNLEVSDLNSLITACAYTGDAKSTKFLKHLKSMVENGEFYQLQAKHVLGDWDAHQVHVAELHRKGEIAFDIGNHVLLKDSGKRGMVVDYLPEEKEFLVVLDPFQLKSFPKKDLEKIAQKELADDSNAVFYAKTRGGRYEIKVFQEGDNEYSMTTYTRGDPSGRSVGFTKDEMIKRVQSEINNAANIDNINYTIVINELYSDRPENLDDQNKRFMLDFTPEKRNELLKGK